MNIEIMKQIKRTNIALAIFFNVVTLGFYSIYWLERKRQYLNSKLPSKQMPITLIVACVIMLILLWTYSYGLLYLYFVAKVLLLLEVRDQIHTVAKIKKDSPYWINGLLVIMFGFLYLIYKIDTFPSDKKTPDNQDAIH